MIEDVEAFDAGLGGDDGVAEAGADGADGGAVFAEGPAEEVEGGGDGAPVLGAVDVAVELVGDGGGASGGRGGGGVEEGAAEGAEGLGDFPGEGGLDFGDFFVAGAEEGLGFGEAVSGDGGSG